MATKSFTDVYTINRSDLKRIRNIMLDTRKLELKTVKGHQDVRDKEELLQILGLNE